MIGDLYSNTYEKIGQYESKYGTCKVIKEKTNRYSYNAKFENNKKREKTENEKEFVTDKYTYYYSDYGKKESYTQYYIYIDHPIELLKVEEKNVSERAVQRVKYDGIKINARIRINMSDDKIVDLYKKMITEICKC